MQFDKMEKVFRTIITEAVDEAGSGLCVHTFGREERYVVVYKNAPTDLELEARRYYDYIHWNKEIEEEFKRKKEEEHSISEQNTGGESSAESTKNPKKQKLTHFECQAISLHPNKNFGMVSSDLKKDKRTVEEALNDIQQKKRLKIQADRDT